MHCDGIPRALRGVFCCVACLCIVGMSICWGTCAYVVGHGHVWGQAECCRLNVYDTREVWVP